jgi:hypothetical protein
LALAAYAEALIGGGRVAVFGDATIGIAAELCKRGARLVHVYDADAARAAEASAQNRNRSIYYAPLSETGDIGVKDGAFDCAIVTDLSLAGDAGALLELVRRVVSSSGAALIASPNADASPLLGVAHGAAPLGYYDLYEAISAHFPSVRMIGQAPFVGYAVAEFSTDGEPEPTVDSSLVGAEGKEPDWFVALASERWVRVDPFCLVEIPVRPALAKDAPAPVVAAGPSVAETELAAARAVQRDQEQALSQERKRLEQANAQLTAHKEELALVRARAENLARALEQEEQRRTALERTVEQQAERRTALEKDLEQHAARRTALEKDLDAARKNPELGRLRDRVAELERSIEQASEPHEAEVGRLEQLLAERGAEILELRREVDRREQLVREMLSEQVPAAVAAVPEPEPEPQPQAHTDVADLRARLDRLAAEVARREADLVAASWKIAAFERRTASPTENDR